jgi:hypothetical protein
VQIVAEASQKFTCPRVTVDPASLTVALRVTTAGETTVDTTLPPEVIVKVVLVGAGVANASLEVQQRQVRNTRSAGFTNVYCEVWNQ